MPEYDNEVWKDVQGYEGLYLVSNLGRVKSLDRVTYKISRWGTLTEYRLGSKILKPNPCTKHAVVTLYKDKLGKNKQIHRAVLEAFVSPCPPGMEGCHNDGNPRNNNVLNLRWDTHKGNHQDRIKHNTSNKGIKNGSAKLNDQLVREIREHYRKRNFTVKKIAETYKVSKATIEEIVARRHWKHVL